MKKQNKNIVFDFAGVIFTWQPHEFMARLLPHLAATPDAARALTSEFFQGFGGEWAEFDRGSVEPAPLAERISQRLKLPPIEARRVIDAVPHELAPIAGTVALLQRLHAKGYPLFFLSNMPAPYADHLDATHAFLDLFECGIYSARVGLIKPEPEIFAHSLETFGIAADQTIFVDDLAANVAAARAAGWDALQFFNPAQCEADLAVLGVRL